MLPTCRSTGPISRTTARCPATPPRPTWSFRITSSRTSATRASTSAGQQRNAHRGQHDRPEPVPEHRRLQRPGSCGPPLQQLLCRRGPQHDAERAGGRSSEQLLAGAATGGTTGSVEYNQISARRRGIFYNLIYGSSTTVPIEYNTITATADANWGSSLWTGVYIVTQQNSVTGTFLDNSISGAGSSYATSAGYTVLSTAATTSVTISGDSSPYNSVSNVDLWRVGNQPGIRTGPGAAAASNYERDCQRPEHFGRPVRRFCGRRSGNANAVSATINGGPRSPPERQRNGRLRQRVHQPSPSSAATPA